MASNINASTSGAGGLITTADNTGNINLQSNGTTVLGVTSGGVAVTGTLSATSTISQNGTNVVAVAPGTNGNVLTSNGTIWTSAAPASGSITLLGTITVTAANSVSLGSLSLSGYKQLCIVYKSLSCNTANSFGYISSDNTTSAARLLYLYSSPTSSGITWIDLGTGAASGGIGYDVGDGSNQGIGLSNVSTSTTTLYFRLASTNTFTATGSIKVYGVV